MYKLLLALSTLLAINAYSDDLKDLVKNPSNDPHVEYQKWGKYFDTQKDKSIAVLSTISENNQPSQRYVLIGKSDDKKLVWFLWKNSGAVKDIEKNPQVSFIHLSDSDEGWLQVEIRGRANSIKENEEIKNSGYMMYTIDEQQVKFVLTQFDEKLGTFNNEILKYKKDNDSWKFEKESYSISSNVLPDED